MDIARDAGLIAREIAMPKDGKMDIAAIKRILPHRYPFLLVDRVVDFEKDKRIVALKNVTANEPFFQGHFPGNPIMPGVLMVEALAQAAGILMLNKTENLNRPAFFIGVDNVRFRKAVIPGDVLRMEITVKRLRSRVAQLRGEVIVDGEKAAGADIMFGFSD